MDPAQMIVFIVFLGTTTGTIHKYLDTRAAIAAANRKNDKATASAVDELRAEIAVLRKHETDAILSFDSTLHTLDARIKHLERVALGEGSAAGRALGAPDVAAARSVPAAAVVEQVALGDRAA